MTSGAVPINPKGENLSAGQISVVRAVLSHVESELIEALPELEAGVNTAAASGSFTATLQIVKAKRGRFVGKVSCRVRTPREPFEIDLHIGDDRQLSLGLPDGYQEEPPTEE